MLVTCTASCPRRPEEPGSAAHHRSGPVRSDPEAGGLKPGHDLLTCWGSDLRRASFRRVHLSGTAGPGTVW